MSEVMTEEDRASRQEEEILQRRIDYTRSQGRVAEATGYCLHCGEPQVDKKTLKAIENGKPVPEGTRRWCDADCRDDWEKENK